MTVIASCGHQLTEAEDLGIALHITGYDREEERCIYYGSYCGRCARKFRAGGYVLETEQEWQDWLSGKLDRPAWY